VGSFFSICCRQTGHFFCHISIPNLFFKLVAGPTSKKSVPSRDSAVCLNRHKSKSVPNCTEATLSTRYSAEAHRFAGISPFKYERRSDFRAVSSDLSLSDARDLLITRTLPLPQTAQTSNQF